jgi:hypothetical protein
VDSTNDNLIQIHNKLEQDGNIFEFDACSKKDYLKEMNAALKKGMVMTFQLWGTNYIRMGWLDALTGCTGACNKDTAVVTYSNISIEKAQTNLIYI